MKKTLAWILSTVIVLLVSFILYVESRFTALTQQKFPQHTELAFHDEVARADVELGKRIYHVRNGCVECHGGNLAGQVVIESFPMGFIRGANLTPAALGEWTDEEIAQAIRYGVHRSGRSLRFMPSFDYEGLSHGDTAALIAYLRSVPAVEAPARPNTYGPLLKTLAVFGQAPVVIPALTIDHRKGFAEKPAEKADLEFGRYLAGSCTGCHGENLRGGPIPGGDPSWPPASPLRFGANSLWTEEKFRAAIETGVSPTSGNPIRPPMPVALLKQLNAMEVQALWIYLSSLN